MKIKPSPVKHAAPSIMCPKVVCVYNLPCVLRCHPPAPDPPLQRQPAAQPHLRLGVSFHHFQIALDEETQ